MQNHSPAGDYWAMAWGASLALAFLAAATRSFSLRDPHREGAVAYAIYEK
jgi:hypothetical protein